MTAPSLLRVGVLSWSILWCAGCAPTTGEQEFSLEQASSLSVSNDGGTVSLVGGIVPDVIFVNYQIFSDGEGSGASDVLLTAGLSGEEFLVAVETPGPDVWVELVVSAPTDLPWRVDTDSGDIFLESLTGPGQVTTTSGVISGGGLEGDVDVAAAISDVHLELEVEGSDQVVIELGEGSIELDVPTPTHASLEASTDEGVLTLWSLPFDGDLDSRVANGILGNGGEASIFLHTAAGNIDLIGSGEEAD